MPSLRWITSSLPILRLAGVAGRAARICVTLATSLRPESILALVATGLIAAAIWETLGRPAALLVIGLLILRDLERKDPPKAS